ncbi:MULTISPECIES: type II toxin-antitoxin system HipA family toxin [unclassified Mycolicibacterium]|uniref:type II toxin-antitoxin system HipA family toxin n=1 Tax=unclassified Mycolicibacterium TaxID=2636767 RepID=UPI0012DE05BF|nr:MULTISPECIES: type II toxin-antitoxin system HipA family toxin [unclassified Mycolicibacterium]MUL84988.1 type II toxin-antitoxin system HipA family toxin [Mycolicibacterium sp. CBMA 329]MUL90955.1 type II toxin-antitoxin system HipA family toxin [Mycolicibacterium sp. CBMA 331]MUL98374.1 type II toxin-antitoxin system HipA family toxin [Mycolicibacterium sp. CBMA 334]MUM28574.1 type II toxin-antitoxin system HipA family toxin [Mycolicibacterium sp. CBMA 295]MUM40714.1 type II toxin-antitox
MTDFEALRDIEQADVYLGDHPVASLTRDRGDEIVFSYTGPAPAPGSAVRNQWVSWSLPRDAEYPLVTHGGAVPTFFAGLLPEGVRLGIVTASTKTSADDHFTLLLAIGADTVGNVRLLPAGTPAPTLGPMFDPKHNNDFRAVFARLTGSLAADPVGLSGVQPKVSAAMWSTPARTTSGPAILKLNPPSGFPRLVENEHFFMQMAADCGLRTAQTQLLHDAQGRSALLVERFDRRGDLRIAQEDACQVAGVYPASKYRIHAETAISALADACARGSGSRATATLELLRIVMFSWLIGNGDLHGKNVSIYCPDDFWRPTPAYDLLTTQPYTGWRDPMAMRLYGRANRLNREWFADAAARLGLRSRAVVRMTDDLVDAAQHWPHRCDEIGFTTRQTELLADLLTSRIDTLK